MTNLSKTPTITTQHWAKWIADIDRLINVRSQFVLSGNIRDRFLTPFIHQDQTIQYKPSDLIDTLRDYLKSKGYDFILIYDMIDGIRIHHLDYENFYKIAKDITKLEINQFKHPLSLDKLSEVLTLIIESKQAKIATIIDYASRLKLAEHCDTSEHRFFSVCEKLAQIAKPQKADNLMIFNHIFWIVNRENDLPAWYLLDNQKIHHYLISKPNYEIRYLASGVLLKPISQNIDLNSDEFSKARKIFASQTDGLMLQEMLDIIQIALRQNISYLDITEAIKCYKIGTTESPWKQSHLRQVIADAEHNLKNRVKGQNHAIQHTVNILKRSIMGLTGSQSSNPYANKPKGVLFFAGPTGVGKTELAKALTELLFNDEHAYIRFDMSEFSMEHSEARLIGSPPGYVGFDSGGELTNAIKERPFSVVLFDEIEKAHPRILDKFLQILDDGRLTDGQGNSVYFSEAIIVFTSNLGIYKTDPINGNRLLNVEISENRETIAPKIISAIEDHFKFNLNRPEILNRLGDNIIVFDFIRQEIAHEIFDQMLTNITSKLKQLQQVDISLSETVRTFLLEQISKNLENGGRGIGNKLESLLINPLSSALFERSLTQNIENTKIIIKSITLEQEAYIATLE